MEKLVSRRAHNPKAVGSSPTPATKNDGLGLTEAIIIWFRSIMDIMWVSGTQDSGSIPDGTTIYISLSIYAYIFQSGVDGNYREHHSGLAICAFILHHTLRFIILDFNTVVKSYPSTKLY